MEISVVVYIAFILYLVAHFCLFIGLVHIFRISFSEKFIFYFHVTSFLFWSIGLAVNLYVDTSALPLVVAILASHGIYTIVFLNFWSLSEGSYFMEVLRNISNNVGPASDIDFSALEKIGDRKKESRIEALVKLKLLRQHEGTYDLTQFGSVVSLGLSTIRWIANHKHIG